MAYSYIDTSNDQAVRDYGDSIYGSGYTNRDTTYRETFDRYKPQIDNYERQGVLAQQQHETLKSDTSQERKNAELMAQENAAAQGLNPITGALTQFQFIDQGLAENIAKSQANTIREQGNLHGKIRELMAQIDSEAEQEYQRRWESVLQQANQKNQLEFQKEQAAIQADLARQQSEAETDMGEWAEWFKTLGNPSSEISSEDVNAGNPQYNNQNAFQQWWAMPNKLRPWK